VKGGIGRVLIIAGSDSGGGAGIQADIKSVTALGGYAMTAITAVTVQNTLGVFGVHPIPTEVLLAQARVVLEDLGADAIKTGMLGARETVEAVAGLLDGPGAGIPLVVDPVMVAKGGESLLADDAVAAVRELMISARRPAHPECARGRGADGAPGAHRGRPPARGGGAAGARGARVLMKGGHLEGQTVVDLLISAEGEHRFESPRFPGLNTHGTGCTLASACAAGLAQGMPLARAVERAHAYTAEAIRRAPGFGRGHGPLDHGWPLR
jgi:hydroxymethylpyrimidine/phosphomethylpyrimidine kinase